MESVEVDSFADLFEDGRINAAISWLLFGFLGLVLTVVTDPRPVLERR